MRAVAVLVVATPCPLLLAAPIAIMSGLSRAAHIGVVIKGGGALERLAAGRVMLFDKTGTLTQGRPALADVVPACDEVDADEILRLAASLDQVSPHVLASSIVTAATRRGLRLEMPTDVVEEHGYGLRGRVGLARGAARQGRMDRRRRSRPGCGRCAGGPTSTARSRCSSPSTACPRAPSCSRTRSGRTRRAWSARCARSGISRVVLVTGDRADIADTVGRIVGVDTVLADCDPADKLTPSTRSPHGATIMVGDGVTTRRRSPRPASGSHSPPAARPRPRRLPTSS